MACNAATRVMSMNREEEIGAMQCGKPLDVEEDEGKNRIVRLVIMAMISLRCITRHT